MRVVQRMGREHSFPSPRFLIAPFSSSNPNSPAFSRISRKNNCVFLFVQTVSQALHIWLPSETASGKKQTECGESPSMFSHLPTLLAGANVRKYIRRGEEFNTRGRLSAAAAKTKSALSYPPLPPVLHFFFFFFPSLPR